MFFETTAERYTNTYGYTCIQLIQVQERHCLVMVSRVHEMRTTRRHRNAPSEHRQRKRERRPIQRTRSNCSRPVAAGECPSGTGANVRGSLLVGRRTGLLLPSFKFFKTFLTLLPHASDHGTLARAIAQTQRKSNKRERRRHMRAPSQEV